MEIEIKEIGDTIKEYVRIGHHQNTSEMREILQFVKFCQGIVEAKKEDKLYRIPIIDILYIESVDDRTFVYLKEECYESRQKLYELEGMLRRNRFIRISKSVIVNLMKVESIQPALNGRYLCCLTNGETVIISRKYVSDFREVLTK